MGSDEWLSSALKEILPKKIDRAALEKSGFDLGLKGKMTAARALATALVAKGLEGDMKAFGIISQLITGEDETADGSDRVLEIRVVE